MNPRTAAVFDAARTQQRSALIGYLPAGFPTVDDSVEIFQTMLDSGVDLLEVGLPYSDPLMDGPAIQESVEIALERGVTTAEVLSVVDRLTPAEGQAVYVMSYWNPIERFGVQEFADELAAAGGSGVIGVGLGVSSADQAASIAGYADGVIVGSAFIRRVLDAESSAEATAEVGRFAAELREGVGRSTHLSKPDA